MRVVRSHLERDALTPGRWDALANRLRANKGGLGDLGGGNHFLDALEPYDDGPLHFLIHTGSRLESGLVDDLVDTPEQFDREFARIVQWAADNRAQVHEEIEAVFGPTELMLDLPHNTYETVNGGGAIIRKGAVHLQPGEMTVIPSHMSGDVVLVRGTGNLRETLQSMSHGTGRTMPRGEAKVPAEAFDFDALRQRIMIPTGVENSSLRTDGPYAYRDLDACLALIDGYVTEEKRFAVVAYMGHL